MILHHTRHLLLLSISFFIGIMLISAQDVGVDDQGNPNDPTINDRANACYTDPRFLNQCDTSIEWVCGYFVIRYDYGLLDSQALETVGCGVYLPSEPEPVQMNTDSSQASTVPPITTPNCQPNGNGAFINAPNNSFKNTGENWEKYPNPGCTGSVTIITYAGTPSVFSLDGQAAATLVCNANAPGTTASQNPSEPNLYACI
ncbi:MAG: hypothetical protein AAFR67_04150 [Chloroflexota bacterium]